ncbi:MAG: serine/threonine-protein kinase PknK, partial [Cyanobacteria bacterium P01_E01_bin.42]
MITSLPGHQILQSIHQGTKTIIYQAKREADSTSVVIKTLQADYPTLEEITRLRHEYQILQSLNIESVIKVYKLLNYEHNIALILEEFGGVPLKQAIVANNLSIEKFLIIAITLIQTLEELHAARVIHKDIKPQNILINPQTGQVKLIDFSIATRLEKETQILTSPNQLEGTLAYMSPEQTGRMNRILDYRTDYYSLGITFYEMVTGRLPFITNDPMEMVHCHIAKTPISPHQINPAIPTTISEIVMKLLAKTAEERYQSPQGLKADLEECLKQWQKTGQIENFTPGTLDRVGRFLIPQKLYGREREVATLLEAFDRVSMGSAELMLVSGYSGVGKTVVVQEIYKPITRQRGYFIAGKFDQFQRDIPYAAIIQAFQELIRQILTESSQKIEEWKTNLQTALKQNGRVVTEVIPELELILGEQPEIPQLGAAESQNRFNQVFRKFVGVFSNQTHPLVLFLDDLQWADGASLKLIELLITDSESHHLLAIGAYRDNEVSPTHLTIKTIEKIQEVGASVNNIVLQPLELGHIRQLVSDTLDEPEKSKSLANLLFSKTQGNPFFFIQLFKTLYVENLLSFDFNQRCWQWSLETIQGWGVTDLGVVNLVSRNIQKLPKQTQDLLKLAACIGNRFYLDILSIVYEKSLVATAEDLWNAIQAGLILPLSQDYKIPLSFSSETTDLSTLDKNRISYKFLHDRVQQAAYSLIPEEQKQETHFKIGNLLWQKTTASELEENVFDIVNQLNIGIDFLNHGKEREELANLNYIAGKKAKQASAYEAALKYLELGNTLTPETAWETSYEFKKSISIELLECLYLNSQFERASQLSD